MDQPYDTTEGSGESNWFCRLQSTSMGDDKVDRRVGVDQDFGPRVDHGGPPV